MILATAASYVATREYEPMWITGFLIPMRVICATNIKSVFNMYPITKNFREQKTFGTIDEIICGALILLIYVSRQEWEVGTLVLVFVILCYCRFFLLGTNQLIGPYFKSIKTN